METEYSYAERIADLLAHLILIATRFDGSFAELEALRDYKLFEQAVDKKLKRLWKMGKHVFITTCEEQAKAFDKTADDVSGNMNQCVIEAAKTALFIDQKISYNIDPAEDNTRDNHLSADDQRIDMSGLFVKCPGDYWEITHLNSEKSLKETGIWINPKAATGIGAEDLTVEEKRSLGNRDSFFHLNSKLNNIRFFPVDRKVSVRNVFIFPVRDRGRDTVRIGFSPMLSDDPMPFFIESTTIKEGRFEKKAFNINGLKDKAGLTERLERDLMHAAEKGVDVFFAPEMLGAEDLVDEEDNYSMPLYKMIDRMDRKGLKPPAVIFLPSIWKKRKNTVYAVQSDGKLIGRIRKTVPFIDTDYGMENLKKVRKSELLVIHFPGIACISVMICAQFLAEDKQNNAEILFRCLGVDLLLVPSYSRGERDFVNKLGRFQEYGVSVVWGDSCNAVRETVCREGEFSDDKECIYADSCPDKDICVEGKKRKLIVGAVFIAGTGDLFSLGKKAISHCGFRCALKDSCIFTIDFPLMITWDKPEHERVDPEMIIDHYYKKTPN